MLEKLCVSAEAVHASIAHHMQREEADVFPLLEQHLCEAQQRSMVYRTIRAMPLRLLERVMPWVVGGWKGGPAARARVALRVCHSFVVVDQEEWSRHSESLRAHAPPPKGASWLWQHMQLNGMVDAIRMKWHAMPPLVDTLCPPHPASASCRQAERRGRPRAAGQHPAGRPLLRPAAGGAAHALGAEGPGQPARRRRGRRRGRRQRRGRGRHAGGRAGRWVCAVLRDAQSRAPASSAAQPVALSKALLARRSAVMSHAQELAADAAPWHAHGHVSCPTPAGAGQAAGVTLRRIASAALETMMITTHASPAASEMR